jgi:hypothetical protein
LKFTTIPTNKSKKKIKTKTMTNHNELTLVEALCIKQHGWGIGEEEKQLYFKAEALILEEVGKLRLEYKKQLKEENQTND